MQNAFSRSFIAAVCVFQVLGCASDGDEEVIYVAPLPEIENQIEIDKLWSYRSDADEEIFSKITPSIAYGKVFVASIDGEVVALDRDSGDEVWEVDVESPLSGGVAAGNGIIIVTSEDAEVIALEEATGKELWRNLVSSEVLAPAGIGENMVVVNTVDGKLFALSAESGKRAWFYDRNVPVLSLRGTASAQIDRGAAVTGFANGKIAAFLIEKGALIWEKRVASPTGRSELARMVDVDANPIIYGDRVYAASYNGNILALELRSGEVIWQRELSTYQNLSVDISNVFATDQLSHVKAMNRLNGATLWIQDQLENRQVTGAGITDKALVVGDFEGYLHFIDKENGKFVGQVLMDSSGIGVQPLVDNGVIYAFSKDGLVTAYRVQ